MSRIVQIKPPEFQPFPAGYYKVRLVKIEDAVSRYGEAYKFWYEVLMPMKFIGNPSAHERRNIVGRLFHDWISESKAKNAELCNVVRVLTGTKLKEGDELDLDKLIGLMCYVDLCLSKGYIVKVIDYFNEEEFKNVATP